jgi:sugar/nucleoside kinase (ribokinase family)
LPQGSTHVPTQPVPLEKIVDPVGLGDTFSAGAVYQLAMTGDLTSAVKEGHAAALEKLLSPRVT